MRNKDARVQGGAGFLPSTVVSYTLYRKCVEDRLRIIHPTILCGSPEANTMDESVVERTRPLGPPELESNIAERWTGVEFLKMGFYKLCWCSGMLSCTSGTARGHSERSSQQLLAVGTEEFAFLVGFAIITGLLRL